jgi:hypothetical protein
MWLFPLDSSKNGNEVDEKYQVGTCSWSLDGERFLESNPGVLWVMGKGKLLKSYLNLSVKQFHSRKW